MQLKQLCGELAVFLFAALGLAALGVAVGVLLSGCAPQKRAPVTQQPAAAVQQEPPPAPAPVATPTEGASWQPVYEPSPPPPARPVRAPRRMEVMGPGGKTIVYEPGKKPVLSCPEFGTLTIKFPAGEQIKKYGSGAAGEWIVQQTSMGVDLPIDTLTIDRTPFAPTTELQVITDADVYQFILKPTAAGVSKDHASVFVVVNPETETRRAERQMERAEMLEHERQAMAIRAPQLDPAHVRVYAIGGDHVPWAPVNVVGDHRHTVIQLPANTGADQPTLTVIEYGKEMRVNTRTLPEENGKGPRIVVDQPFTEARLIGAGGTVSIVGKGN